MIKNLMVLMIPLMAGLCGSDYDEVIYDYTLKNNSGYDITTKIYKKYKPEFFNTIQLRNGDSIHKRFTGDNVSMKYNFSSLLSGSIGWADYDSLVIYYEDKKYKIYTDRFEINNTDSRNLLNYMLFGGESERYEFTNEDYLNAQECNSNCKYIN